MNSISFIGCLWNKNLKPLIFEGFQRKENDINSKKRLDKDFNLAASLAAKLHTSNPMKPLLLKISVVRDAPKNAPKKGRLLENCMERS